MPDLLSQSFLKIQNEYLEVLKQLSTTIQINGDIDELSIDKVNLFWHKNYKLISLYLNNIPKKKRAFFYTGATNYIQDDGFLLAGKYHFFDDPLPEYIDMVHKTSDRTFKRNMADVIVRLIDNNISTLTNSSVIVLPLRYLMNNEEYSLSDQQEREVAQRLFISMFRNVENIEEYFSTIKNVNDIAYEIDPTLVKTLLLSDYDDISLPIETRLQNHFSFMEDVYEASDDEDSKKLFNSICGYFIQVLKIFQVSIMWNLTPFFPSSTSFNYFMLLLTRWQPYSDQSELTEGMNSTLTKLFLLNRFSSELAARDYDTDIQELELRMNEKSLNQKLFKLDIKQSEKVTAIVDSLLN